MSKEMHNFSFTDDYINYAKIKVVGVGGGGGNAINRMIEAGLKGVDFIALNTDAQVLDKSLAPVKVQIGAEITNGLGAGANPEVGRKAIEENRKEVAETIGTPNMVFITAGMGGGTGTGAAPIVAEIAKAAGALTVAIVTKPFRFEGAPRSRKAMEGIEELRAKADTLITIPNERLLEIVDKKTKLSDAFATADEILHQATKGISDLISIPGLVNCDFADVRTVMLEKGDAIMGTGYAEGDDKAIDAATEAISSPLLENSSISGAKGVLINITGGEDMSLSDVNIATSLIYEEAGDSANIIFGAVIDPEMKDKMRVTVIATGFNLYEVDQPEKPAVKSVVAQPDFGGASRGEQVVMPFEKVQKPVQSTDVFAPPPSPGFHHQETETAGLIPTGNGNGNGNKNANSKNNVPYFSGEDRTIPAYIRRMDDTN